MKIRNFKRNLSIALLTSLIIGPLSPVVGPANASTNILTIVASGGATEGTGWTYSSNTITVTETVSIDASDVITKLNNGDLTINADSITVNSQIVATSNNYSLTLQATGDINIAAAITTLGGNISLIADSDGNRLGGIQVDSTTITSNGGDISFGGGYNQHASLSQIGSGRTAQNNLYYSINLKDSTITASGGDISVKGNGGNTINDVIWCVQIYSTLITDGSGAISVSGDCSDLPNTGNSGTNKNPWAVVIPGTLQTANGDITLEGKSTTIRANSRGFSVQGNIQSSAGSIFFTDTTTNTSSANYTGPYLPGVDFGKGSLASSSSDITIKADEFQFDSTPTINTTGNVVIEPTGSNFTAAINLTLPVIEARNLSIGKQGVTQNITLGSSTVSEAMNIYSTGTVTQASGKSISATGLGLFQSGTYTLTNTSNNFGTVAAGSSGSKIGSLNLVDASGGLTIGQVGAIEGIYATGDVKVETLAGDISLNKSIVTDSTSGTAITLNAGKNTAAGTDTGGDILVSGSPSITKGANGIGQFFSGSEAASTGLTTLVGGSNYVQYGVDETSTLNPTLVAGNSYALYRSSVASPPPTSSGGSSSGSSSSSDAPTAVEEAPVKPKKKPKRIRPVSPTQQPTISTPIVRNPIDLNRSGFDPDKQPTAVIGGSVTSLNKELLGPKELALQAGQFRFNVNLAKETQGEIKTETPTRSPELIVPRTESLALKGDGSYPGSSVQVWLTGDGTNAREIARVPVAVDGTFETNMVLAASRNQLPVPIGRQVLQVVGYDQNGRQTIVDMTVNIAQGAPAPEPNRAIGELPKLMVGENLSTSAGLPEDARIATDQRSKSVAIEGRDWSIKLNAKDPKNMVEETASGPAIRLAQSSIAQAAGDGFMPETVATVWLFSDPTLLGTVTVDENGQFSLDVLIDAQFISAGEHTLQIQGVGKDGFIKATNLGVLVEESSSTIATTSSNSLNLAIGVGVVLLVTILLIALRRRRNLKVEID